MNCFISSGCVISIINRYSVIAIITTCDTAIVAIKKFIGSSASGSVIDKHIGAVGFDVFVPYLMEPGAVLVEVRIAARAARFVDQRCFCTIPDFFVPLGHLHAQMHILKITALVNVTPEPAAFPEVGSPYHQTRPGCPAYFFCDAHPTVKGIFPTEKAVIRAAPSVKQTAYTLHPSIREDEPRANNAHRLILLEYRQHRVQPTQLSRLNVLINEQQEFAPCPFRPSVAVARKA